MKLKKPDDSTTFFEDLKVKSESYWAETELDPNIYGFQIQKNTKWKKGLSEEEIEAFQKVIDIKFQEGLKNFYRVMKGVDRPSINIYGSSGEETRYEQRFYSFPEDVEKITQMLDWIYDANGISKSNLEETEISKIFPIYAHRFVLTDTKENTVLSMYGDDIIFWADNISKSMCVDLFDNIENISDFESNPDACPEIKFWLDS